MKYLAFSLITLFIVCGCSSPGQADDSVDVIGGAVKPPEGPKKERTPKLVNYFHMNYELKDGESYENCFAQWDIIILCPEWIVDQRDVDLDRIRTLNPDIVILAWVPLGQQPPGTHHISEGIPAISESPHWYCLKNDGDPVYSPWNEYMMNPYADGCAWPRYAAEFVLDNYLRNGEYDGIMFDMSSESAPSWFSPDLTCDIDGDGDTDEDDDARYREGISLAYEIVRTELPETVLIGNGGVPWQRSRDEYFDFANGCMHENALGDEFGTSDWDGLWTGIDGNMNPDSTADLQRHHYVQVDLRSGRDVQEAEEEDGLSAGDLRRMRLGLASSMLRDTYFGFDRGDGLHGQFWWFPEYDADLGPPLGNYRQDIYGAGTWSREYAEGTVIVNPTSTSVPVAFPRTMEDMTTGDRGIAFTVPLSDGRIFVITEE